VSSALPRNPRDLARGHGRRTRLNPLRTAPRGAADRGSVAIFVAVITPALLVVFGLVLDLGQELRAQRTAQAAAQEAARAGVEAVDAPRYRSGGGIGVNAGIAAAAARSYLSGAGYSGTVSLPQPATLAVSVTVTQPTHMLAVIGISSWTATETASASLEEG